MVTLYMAQKNNPVIITEGAFSTETGVITLEISLGDYSLTGKTVTAVFSQTAVETAPLTISGGLVQLPITAGLLVAGENQIQLNIREGLTLEQSPIMKWTVGMAVAGTNSTPMDVDIITYLLSGTNTTAPCINVMFPPSPLIAAIGDDATNNYPALQAMLNYLDSVGGGTLIFPQSKIFVIGSALKYYSNITIDLNKSTLKMFRLVHAYPTAVLYCGGDPSKISDNVTIKNGTLDGGLMSEVGVSIQYATNNIVKYCTIKNILNPTNNKGTGVWLDKLTSGCKVLFNDIYMGVDSPFETFPAMQGILCLSATTAGVDNTLTYPDGTDLSEKHLIQGNHIYYGTHGIQLFAAQKCNISDNYLFGQTHRGIILDPSAHYNNIIGNTIEDFGSSGIHLSHGSSYNNIVGNICITTVSIIEGSGIKCYYGGHHNHCSGNFVKGTLFAAYRDAMGCPFNSFTDNVAVSCGTGLEIESYVNANSDYFGAGQFQPTTPPTTEGIHAVGNSFYLCTNGIKIAQRGTFELKDSNISNNMVDACTNGVVLVEETANDCYDLTINGNSVIGGTTAWTLPRGTNHTTEFMGNTGYNFIKQAGVVLWNDTAGRLKFGVSHPSDINTGGKAVAISYAGATGDRPGSTIRYTSMMYFDTTLVIPIWWSGTNWVNSAGATV